MVIEICSKTKAEELVKLISDMGRRTAAFQADVTDRNAIKAMHDQAEGG